MKNTTTFFLILGLSILFGACQSSNMAYRMDPDYGGFEDQNFDTDYDLIADRSSDFNAFRGNVYRKAQMGDLGQSISVAKTKKIISSASMKLSVENPDTANERIKSIAKQYEGYVVEIGTYKSKIRIKAEHFNAALEQLYELGYVEYKNISGRDVSANYLDMKIRLENAIKARKRYLELLAQAENVEAALKVEKELERLNRTIDQLKGKMSNIDHLVAYSTITINLNEKVKPGVLGYLGIGVYRSVKWLFVRN